MNCSTAIVIIPVYEDRHSARLLLKDLAKSLDDFYLIAVDDGSTLLPIDVQDLEDADVQGEVLYLSTNVGHQRAIATGLNHVAKNYPDQRVVILDSDGEDKTSDIPCLFDALQRENVDIIVAKRGRRSERPAFRFFYFIYKLVFNLLTGRNIDFGNFMALTPGAAKRIAKMQEVWIHLAATILISRLRVSSVITDRGQRYLGSSKMNFVSLVLHGMRSVMVFAEDVLVRLGAFCVLFALFAVSSFIVILLMKSFGYATPGWVTMVSGFLLVILFQVGILTLVTLLMTGIIRGIPLNLSNNYQRLIDRIVKTSGSN